MLDRQRGKIVFECDKCAEVLITDTADFYEARQMLTDDGWKSRKAGADWLHYCATCGEKE